MGRKWRLFGVALVASGTGLIAAACSTNGEEVGSGQQPAPAEITTDEFVQRADAVCMPNVPPVPNLASYGMDIVTGRFRHPLATPHQHEPQPFDGELEDWDTNEYIDNMTVEAYYPDTVEPFHTWQNIVDFDGQRYLYQYVRRDMKIFNITDPKDVSVVREKGHPWGPNGPGNEVNPFESGDMFGAASIQWNDKLDTYVMVQAFEVQRFGVIDDKRTDPAGVARHRNADHLKGFKVYAMHGPMPEEWELLAAVTTDVDHPEAPIGQQQGSGVRDIPTYFGGQYMFVAAAPDATYALTEYPTDLYSAGYQAWDMSDPAHPVFVGQFTAPGQRLGDEDAYKQNPRCGNRTSWFGARMSIFVPTPVEDGGRYGYGAMGGLGFYVFDISDPANIEAVGHLDFPPSVAGTEGDNIDVSQVERTGVVYYSGYPLAEDCWEPYKDVYMIDVRDPAKPSIRGTLPRPVPPEIAPFTDYCQRRGSFGPKRSGYYTQPGTGREGVLPYAFYNAGVQIFDVSGPSDPTIVAYFVPRFDTERVPDYARGNLAHGIYVEYDRNLIWLFVNHGIYVLSTPVLGEPSFEAPAHPWPPRKRASREEPVTLTKMAN